MLVVLQLISELFINWFSGWIRTQIDDKPQQRGWEEGDRSWGKWTCFGNDGWARLRRWLWPTRKCQHYSTFDTAAHRKNTTALYMWVMIFHGKLFIYWTLSLAQIGLQIWFQFFHPASGKAQQQHSKAGKNGISVPNCQFASAARHTNWKKGMNSFSMCFFLFCKKKIVKINSLNIQVRFSGVWSLNSSHYCAYGGKF